MTRTAPRNRCESDSIGAVIEPVTSRNGVGLFSCRGQAGKSFVWQSVQEWFESGLGIEAVRLQGSDPAARYG